jgi:hypothetical protein
MTDTREKLLKAKYFLERMIKNQDKRDSFKYNLSAFLSAARRARYGGGLSGGQHSGERFAEKVKGHIYFVWCRHSCVECAWGLMRNDGSRAL